MSNGFRWSGLDELREELRNLPEEMTGEASHIVEGAANSAEADIKAGYPSRTGNLRNHLQQTHFDRGRFSAGVILKNTARHAWLFENGSQARHTDIGADRGSMPAGHVFVPAVLKARRRMYEELKALVTRKGLQVSGDA